MEDLTLFTFGGTDQFILIAEEDATTQAHVWYNIQFSKEASNAFNKGWTLGKSKPLFSSAYTYIDTDGADTQGNIPALDTKLALDEYSAIYNTWMHHSVLATTQESAAQLFIIEEANSTGGDKEGTVDNESPSTPQSTE